MINQNTRTLFILPRVYTISSASVAAMASGTPCKITQYYLDTNSLSLPAFDKHHTRGTSVDKAIWIWKLKSFYLGGFLSILCCITYMGMSGPFLLVVCWLSLADSYHGKVTREIWLQALFCAPNSVKDNISNCLETLYASKPATKLYYVVVCLKPFY